MTTLYMSIKVKVDPKSTHFMELWQHVNRHLTVFESADLNYNQEQSSDPNSYIDKNLLKPKELSSKEYLARQNLSQSKPTTPQILDQLCVICLTLFELDECYRQLNCGHIFHTDCIDSWLSQNLDDFNCAICRTCQYK